MRASAFVLVLVLAVAPACRGQSSHLADDHQLGLGAMIGGLEGNLSGFTTGVGAFDDERVNQYALQVSVPLGHTHLDMEVRHARASTISRGAFSFDSVFFAEGANVDLELTWGELVWRLHLLDRPAMRIGLLAGARVVNASIRARTTTRLADYDALHLLPEVGASLEARIYPRARLYGLVKWMDVTAVDEGNRTLQVEGGLTYLVPAPTDNFIGIRVTGGFRYLNLQVTDRVGETNQVQFDVATTGPFLEAARVF